MTLDPYQPPATDAAAPYGTPLPAERTRVPKIFGVLSIVFASIVLLFSLFGMLGGAMGGILQHMPMPADDPASAELHQMMVHMARIYRIMSYQSFMVAVLSGFLLAIGIGQTRYRQWAQRWSVYWGAAALVAVAGMVMMSIYVIGPAYEQMMTTLSHTALARGGEAMPFGGGFGSLMGGTAAVGTVIFYSPYPILLMVFFSRPNVRAAMTS